MRAKFENLEHLKSKVNEVIFVHNNEFKKIYGNEKNHQGIILKTSKLKQPSIDEIIIKSKEKNQN